MFLISHVRVREKFEQVVIPDGNIKTINQAIEKYFFPIPKMLLNCLECYYKRVCLPAAGRRSK